MARYKKRTTRLALDIQARRAKGIPKKCPWSFLDRKEPAVKYTDEDGEWERSIPISRQRMLLRCSPSRHAPLAEGTSDIVREAAREHAALVADGAGVSKRTQQDYDRQCRSYESWVLYQLKDTDPERVRIKAIDDALWGAGAATADLRNVVKSPASVHAVLTYLYVMTGKDCEYTTESSAHSGQTYKSRGVMYSSVSQFITAQKSVDRRLFGRTDLEDERITDFMSKCSRGYVPRQAPAFDPVVEYPRLYEALFAPSWEGAKNSTNSGLQRQELWTLIILAQAIGARLCLFSRFCPLISQVEIPPEAIDLDGLPRYFKLTLNKWKHNPGQRTQQLIIQRNTIDPRFCPVLALVTWPRILKADGIEDGPLFPALDNDHDAFVRVEGEDGKSHLCTLTESCLYGWVTALFEYVGGGLKDCTFHSIRRVFVKWGARCGGQQADIMVGGRWLHASKKFMEYWGDGQVGVAETLNMKKRDPRWVDPVYKWWVWKPITTEAASGRGGAMPRDVSARLRRN